MEIKLKPVGFVKTEEKDHFGGWAQKEADLVIDEKYQEGLKDLKDYSHLIVLYFMHEVKSCQLRHVPQGKTGLLKIRGRTSSPPKNNPTKKSRWEEC